MKDLPNAPDHSTYANMLREISAEKRPAHAVQMFREMAEADFYAFVRYGLSFGRYKIEDPGHKRRGGLWVDDRWVFDRCRELQQDVEDHATDVFYNWPRFFFKTQLVTTGLTLWELLRNPSLTIAVITHKVDQVGEALFSGIQTELEQNKMLIRHWPHVLCADKKDYPLWTNTALTVKRPLGPREPSISVHGLDKLPDAAHYDRITEDDGVVAKTVANPRQIQATLRQRRRATALGRDNSIVRYVGTIWAEDDPNMLWIKDGVFSRRSHVTGLVHPNAITWSKAQNIDDWRPVLRSAAFFKDWRRKMGEYEFSCQIMGQPVAREEQTFEAEWIASDKGYFRAPFEEKADKNIAMIIDPAGEERDLADFWVIWVVGLGSDKKFYALDLWRERMMLGDALDLVFALRRFWQPETVWIEEFGAQGNYQTFRREMDVRSYRFNMQKLPSLKRSKEDRIQVLQPFYQREDIVLPRGGFGHGSGPAYIDALRARTGDRTLTEARTARTDGRDTLEQYRVDEYSKWTPIKGSISHDDMLDCQAWMVQPEVIRKFAFPEDTTKKEQPDYAALIGEKLMKGTQPRTSSFAAVSGWGF